MYIQQSTQPECNILWAISELLTSIYDVLNLIKTQFETVVENKEMQNILKIQLKSKYLDNIKR